jgi:hypothetical protein
MYVAPHITSFPAPRCVQAPQNNPALFAIGVAAAGEPISSLVEHTKKRPMFVHVRLASSPAASKPLVLRCSLNVLVSRAISRVTAPGDSLDDECGLSAHNERQRAVRNVRMHGKYMVRNGGCRHADPVFASAHARTCPLPCLHREAPTAQQP